MCNIAEYIVMRRASHIINSIINEERSKAFYYSPTSRTVANIIDAKPYIGGFNDDYEMAVRFQRRLEDILSLVFEGCKLTRFVAIDKSADEFKPVNTIPMYLLEVFEPSHCFVPIYVVDDAVLAVSPFSNSAIKKVSRNDYIMELFPTSYIMEHINDVSLSPIFRLLEDPAFDYTDENGNHVTVSKSKLISDLVLLFSLGITNRDRLLTNGYSDITSDKVMEVGAESSYFTKMRKLYSFESFDNAEAKSDGVISTTDFMPIYLTTKEVGSGMAVISDKVKENGEVVNTISLKPQLLGVSSDDKDVKAVLLKEPTSTVRYFLIELDEYYYIGNNKAIAFVNGEFYPPIDLLESNSARLEHPITGMIATESKVSDLIKSGGAAAKNLLFILKKFGIKHGSNAAAVISQLFKSIGIKNIKWCMTQFGSTFKRGLDLEKADTLELQEKLLNDELDGVEERVTSYAKTWFKAVPLTVFCGSLLFFPLAWLISRSRTKNARVRAMERLELRFDNIIERLERKINYAEERSENESVDQLIRERQMYQAARMRLLKLKDDAYNKGRIKYATFDKDLTLTASQRIDAYLTGSRD